jgi:hypothetical protein
LQPLFSHNLAAVYTSYDYGAPISESRLMTPKGYEIKLQGMWTRLVQGVNCTFKTNLVTCFHCIATFLRDVKPFLTTTNVTAKVDNDAIRVDGLKDINSDTTFYIVQHVASSSTKLDKYVGFP